MPEKLPEETEGELTIVPTKENAAVEIIPFGTTDRIRLSAAIVRQMIATPTRSGKQPDDNQCIKFIMLCKARHLNPFEGDAFMLGYDTQGGPQWSLITAHQVFLKRAEASKGFNGMESGVIVKTNDGGGILEREGDLVYDDEKLIGGWAKVYRKDREKPFYRRLKLATFNTGRSRWEKDPAGMICKCAEADALRTAFPTHLGGLYIEEERPPIDVSTDRLEIKRAKVPRLKDEENGGDAIRTDNAPTVDNSTQQEAPVQPHNAAPTVQPTSAASKKKPEPLKKKTPSTKPTAPGASTRFQAEMLQRLSDANATTQQLLEVAWGHEWCSPDETWPLAEDKLERFLDSENWAYIREQLDALK